MWTVRGCFGLVLDFSTGYLDSEIRKVDNLEMGGIVWFAGPRRMEAVSEGQFGQIAHFVLLGPN